MTPRTKAIVAVDIYGYPCELDPLRAIADKHGLALIQDSCEALGAEYKGRPIGSHGPGAVFAFYPNKQITTGEGGMVTTHSEEEWRLLRSLRNQGRGDAGGWLEHVRLGFNYRIDDIRAALGLGQLEKLDEILALRSAVAKRYDELLGGIDGVELPCADDADHKRSWFVYVVKLPDNEARERVIAHFEREAIGYNRYLPSIHLQPYMRERYGFAGGPVPGVGGRELAHARAAVLHRARARRAGAGRRGACGGPLVELKSLDAVEAFVTKDGSTIRELHHTQVQSLAEATLRSGAGDRAALSPRHGGDLLRPQGPGQDGDRRRDGLHASGRLAVLIPPGAWHQLENNGTSELRILCCCAPPYSHDDTFFE